ncbi:hypothetical protein PHYSODRAFT_303473 [Phytophthora sojae]|uniref:Uncharacterized protein n=1 Tax=Phytophthora sojae (strain P6497) TaxID=1094619 RepID=G4ZSN4_PHYSP|nr:hypothetical protein PHYSODRAFT_303473 [Phytophthora sojae]EGZ14256.1 hypothetical protein PHYSODRAFT_303473 [Phytophthora sojae]|eukprot:XP_009531685.1 hypothetical protein PHYSODRAFT_303473 [Phytophthora sojae]
MAKKPNQCAYSSGCCGRLAIKKNGKPHTMCETHRRYQAKKQRQRRCEKHPPTLRETQCRYPGCEEVRAIKSGKMLQLCEMHRARHNEDSEASTRPGAARMPPEAVSESEATLTAGKSPPFGIRTLPREMTSNSFRPDELSRSTLSDLSRALTDRQHQRSQADALFFQHHAEIWSKQYISALNKHSN